MKPSNILLDEAGHVRLTDLGLAFDFKKETHGSAVYVILILAHFMCLCLLLRQWHPWLHGT